MLLIIIKMHIPFSKASLTSTILNQYKSDLKVKQSYHNLQKCSENITKFVCIVIYSLHVVLLICEILCFLFVTLKFSTYNWLLLHCIRFSTPFLLKVLCQKNLLSFTTYKDDISAAFDTLVNSIPFQKLHNIYFLVKDQYTYLAYLLKKKKSDRNLLPSPIIKLFTKSSKHKSVIYRGKAFDVMGPKLWNSLPDKIWNADSFTQ